MTAITGNYALRPSGKTISPSITGQMGEYLVDYWPASADIIKPARVSSLIEHFPVEANGREIVGSIARSYSLDYYYHLIVTPSSVNLGNLLSSQTREVKLWNAYLEPVQIASLLVDGGEGVSINPPSGFDTLPFTLKPLQEITYQLTVTLQGPPSINSTVTWGSDHENADVRVTGSRVTLFPFIPDWNAGIDETLSARSSLLRSPDGTEQSISLRNRFRRAYGIPYSLAGEDAQLADNLLFGWQGRIYGIPAWPEQDYLTAPVASGDSVVYAPIAGKTILAGSLIMVFSGRQVANAEIKEVLSVTANSVVVKTPFASSWPAGSRILPILFGAAAPQLQGTRLVPNYLQVAIQFNFQPLSTDDNAPEVVAPNLYRGYELYLGRTNWRDNLSMGIQTDVQVIDMQTGVFRLRPQSGFSNIGRSHEWFLKSFDEVNAFRRWLKRRRGKTVGVWMPSAVEDFTLASTVVSNTLSVPVKSNGYTLMVKQHEARRDIYIRLRDGTSFNRRILNSADAGNGTTTLFIDTEFGRVINPQDVMQFSYLSFYRMASDDVTIHWHVPGKAEAVTGLIPTKALL